jgi:hypothetical protein
MQQNTLKLLLIVTTFAVLAINVLAAEGAEDTTNWNKNHTVFLANEDIVEAVVVDGNAVYVGGYIVSASNGYDWSIRKYNATGYEDTVNWNKLFTSGGTNTDRLTSMAVDSNHNLYAVGFGNNIADTNSYLDWWIKKFDSAGTEDTVNWNKTYTSPGVLQDGAYAVAIDSNDNIYVAGNIYVNWSIRKFSSNGVEDTANWNKTVIQYSASSPSAMAIDSDNNVYVVGSAGNYGLIKKYGASGVEDTVNWNKTISTSIGVFPNAVAIDSSGNVYVAGYGTDLVGSTGYDWWVKKYSPNGVEDTANWNKTFAGPGAGMGSDLDIANSVFIDGNNDVYVVGYGTQLVSGSTARDWWLKKFDPSGVEDAMIWNKTIDANTGNDEANAVAIDNDNNVYVGGTGDNLASGSSGIDWWIKKFEGATIGTQPTAATYVAGTTDFASLRNFVNVSNMTLVVTNTTVKWLTDVNVSGENFDTNIKMGSKFVSIDVGALGQSINSSAVVNMSGVSCAKFKLYYASGFYSDAATLIAGGTQVATQSNLGGNCADATKCTALSCSGGVLSFTAQHFDGFGEQDGPPAAVPEFGTIAIFLALGMVAVGLTRLRKR